jgi:hypothetical protein
MLSIRSELTQKTFATIYTQKLKSLSPGKVWINPQYELQCSIGLDQKV